MSNVNRRSVQEFEAVFRAISKHPKESIVLVGGHAVNVWAMTYEDSLGASLRPHKPLTSSDMDIVATRNALLDLHRDLGGHLQLSGPREITDGSLVLGVEPDTRRVDVLRYVNGVPKIRGQDSIPLNVCGYDVPVLFPHLLMQGKLANALHLDQGERQDIKHVKIMALVLHEFMKEIVSNAAAPNEKSVLASLQETMKVLHSKDAVEFSRLHGVDFRGVMPVDAIAASRRPRLANFGKIQLSRTLARKPTGSNFTSIETATASEAKADVAKDLGQPKKLLIQKPTTPTPPDQ